ncbi:MAG: competence type IV pilus minor pilin ComGD [Coprobacillus sp.]
MLTNKGFTLIETLFVMFIICVLFTITMTLRMPEKKIEKDVQEISHFIKAAQIDAMRYKQTSTLLFSHDKVEYSYLDKDYEYILRDNLHFDEHQLTFNSTGGIKGAKTVTLHINDKQYEFVFQVGSGCFYVR